MARLRVLVTNDDGVDAPGLDALVRALAADDAVELVVVAPVTNQTGASAEITTTALDVTGAATASGHPATAIAGTPADTVLFALHALLPAPPDLVVAGVNAGPNLAEFIAVSGTVNAALTAASLGVPAIAASQGLALAMDYAAPARFVADVVRRFGESAQLRGEMTRGRPVVLNVNFPACAPAAVRGVRVVPLGRLRRITGYRAAAGAGPYTTWTPTVLMGDVSRSDCGSSVVAPADDLEAFNNGFASVTPLAPDLGLAPPFAGFRVLER